MADISLSRRHTLGLDGARRAADDVAARLAAEYGVRSAWAGDVLAVRGRGVTGELRVSPDVVLVSARLSALARAFRGALEREIERELDRTLAAPTS